MRRIKFSKEVKIEACEKYHNGGGGSFRGIAKEVGCNKNVLTQWYYKYIQHGPSAFDSSTNNKSYDKEFKLSIIESYLSGNYSMEELSTKYNITYSMSITFENFSKKQANYRLKMSVVGYNNNIFGVLILRIDPLILDKNSLILPI